MVTHLELDILECEVKWALESITMNKASEDDRSPAELFQILKDDAVLKCCTPQYASKFGELRTGKAQFLFQAQRRAMSKNVQTTVQLCLFDMLARLCPKSFKALIVCEPRTSRCRSWVSRRQRSYCQQQLLMYTS